MELCSIASGSSGNCIYVGTNETHLLVDAGISKKRIESGLTGIDIDPASLSGVLVTHEHSDHISGLATLIKRYRIPIYTTEETARSIMQTASGSKIDPDLFHFVKQEESFFIDNIEVTPFPISHDAVNPAGYTFCSEGKKAAVATDLGVFTETIVRHLTDVNALLLEANHDVHMLEAGSYPYYLKRRILGERGHLSNENSGILLSKIWSQKLKYVYLGHLSKENNFPDLAYESVHVEIQNVWKNYADYTRLDVAPADIPCEPVFV